MNEALRYLSAAANIASIVTAVIAAWAGITYLYRRRQKRLRLENYLKTRTADTNGLIRVIELAAELGMTEAEVIDAAFRSSHVALFPSANMIGSTPSLLLRYSAKAKLN